MSEKSYSLDISWLTIVRLSITAMVLYLVYLTKDILIWFVFAVIISVLFDPVIDYLHEKRIPRSLAVVLVYFGFFGLISFSIYYTIPLFVREIQGFSQSFSQYFQRISFPLTNLGLEAFKNFNSFLQVITQTLQQSASSIFSGLFSFFGGVSSTLFTLSLALFLSLEGSALEKTLKVTAPEGYEDFLLNLWEKCRKRVTAWFGVRLLASVFVGLLSYVVFLLFNVKYPFSLALLAGVLEFIPILGPLITGVIAFLLVGLDSLIKAFFVLVFMILIQQIEGHILTPILSKKIIGLPPALILMALAIGGKLWGLLGAILAIPLLGILFEFTRGFLKKRKQVEASNR